jgi:hypothetical protein
MTEMLVTAILGEIARRLVVGASRRSRARRAAGASVYPISWMGYTISAAAIALLVGLAIAAQMDGADWRIAAILGAFAVLCLAGFPGPIVVDPVKGISAQRWYGRPKQIGWYDVAKLLGPDDLGQFILVSNDGRKIVHSGLHADGPGFRDEVLGQARMPIVTSQTRAIA